ncbi:MAG: hypothetical protein HYV63_16780 [Candidatus Schekmanbacteria bacterium]|nr:hypothetical protein [Candidatus Schekmanbacteria bacterium]
MPAFKPQLAALLFALPLIAFQPTATLPAAITAVTAESLPARERPIGAGVALERELSGLLTEIDERSTCGTSELCDEKTLYPSLRKLWTLIGHRGAMQRTHNPKWGPADLVTDLEGLGSRAKQSEVKLSVEALELARGAETALVIAVNCDFTGTVLVVAGNDSEPFSLRWNLKDVAAENHALDNETGHWAFEPPGRHYAGGPLAADSLLALSPARNANPRFAVVALSHPGAGGTYPRQLGIWEWNGADAIPLLIDSYLVSFGTPAAVQISGDVLAVATKEEVFNSFGSCGACPDAEGVWRVRVTADGVQDLGHELLVPELAVVDALVQELGRGADVSDKMSPATTAALRAVIPHDDGERVHLGQHNVRAASRSGDETRLRLFTDETGLLQFTFRKGKNGKPFVVEVRAMSGEED